MPNPFENMENGLLLNWVAAPIMHLITYGIVGQFYERSSNPTTGSLLYLLFYCIHTGLLLLMSLFQFSKVPVIIICIVYAIIISAIKIITDNRIL